MKHLKLFESYIGDEDLSIEDKLKKAEEFLDDCFTELFDEWRLTHGSLSNILNNREEKVYYFVLEADKADCNLIIVFDKNNYTKQIKDMTSDANHIFMKKVKPQYKFSLIESSAVFAAESLWRILIKVNVADKNYDSYYS